MLAGVALEVSKSSFNCCKGIAASAYLGQPHDFALLPGQAAVWRSCCKCSHGCLGKICPSNCGSTACLLLACHGP